MSSGDERPYEFPKLPILSPAEIPPPTRKTEREKYGGLFYLGIVGIVVLIGMVSWFAYGFWSLRAVWEDVYVLHNPRRNPIDRIEAGFRLSRDPRLNDEQRMEICLRRDVPAIARYLVAESISTDIVASDPRSFSLAVARSPEWPDWLRLLLTRRLACGAARGYAIPGEALDELEAHADPMIALWANAARAIAAKDAAPAAIATLERSAQAGGRTGELASLLLIAVHSPESERERRLDEITLWLRVYHPESLKIWSSWAIVSGKLHQIGPI